ncbi:hypothetical protein A3736_01880 [Erythrobacter sp. HI0063]|uniref:hypothetical protein n=1 Tax=Erythrobacter sp. HI0063 TaxID=1822240 RepID=UPI0007C265ED|nr:hypothetical protein [Erythrobacter sp. HI0063]KZY55401.1 hypothetical protein A3736_01880 [Erythrobacter sp. HI0063]
MIENLRELLGNLSRGYRAKTISERELEHRLLERISYELDQKEMDRAIWLKAFSEAEADESKAKALYIRHRLRRLQDEVSVIQLKDASERATTYRQVQLKEREERAQERKRKESENREQFLSNLSSMLMVCFILLATAATSFFIFYQIFMYFGVQSPLP